MPGTWDPLWTKPKPVLGSRCPKAGRCSDTENQEMVQYVESREVPGEGLEEQGAGEAGPVLCKTSCTEEGNLKKAET